MKHKSWIKNYEHDFERLAEEIGDLRYDTLSDFLGLLANKIKRDGDKDSSRGRTKLAHHLENTATSLSASAASVNKAWGICEPFMFPVDITKKVRATFKNKTQRNEAFKLLSGFYKKRENDITFRLGRCLLHDTNGSVEKLKTNLSIANQDYRDIIIQAEYDDQMNWMRNYNRPFLEEEITKEDIEKDEYISVHKDSSLPF